MGLLRSKSNETNITYTPEPGNDSVRIRHELPLEWGAKALSQKGLRFTQYTEVFLIFTHSASVACSHSSLVLPSTDMHPSMNES